MSQTGEPNPRGGIANDWFDPVNPSMNTMTTPDVATQATTTQPDAVNRSSGQGPTNGLIGRTSIALIGVLAVILLCAWLLKRLGFQRDRGGQALPVVASRSLGQRERIVIVEVEAEWLVLGVTAQQITPLHRCPAPAERPAASPGERGDTSQFGQIMAESIARFTGRRSS